MDEIKNKGPHKCPVCGKHEFSAWDSYEVCPECGWEDNAEQELDPDDELGPNLESLNDYKAKYEGGWRADWMDNINDDDE